jgi:hypothetical protein
MRGFRTKGLGPRVKGAGAACGAKGGDAFFTVGASSAFPLPSRLLEALGVQVLSPSPARGTRRVRLVRGEGRGVST